MKIFSGIKSRHYGTFILAPVVPSYKCVTTFLGDIRVREDVWILGYMADI